MIIAVINNKGGVGKTTTTVHVGYALAQQGKRVLCVDMDGQANFLLHVFPPNLVYELRERQNGKPLPIMSHDNGVDVLPLSYLQASQNQYAKIIRDAAKGYDITLIDCPPSLEVRTLASLDAAQGVLIPTEPENLSYKGLVTLLRLCDERSLAVIGILVTRFDKKKTAHNIYLREIATSYAPYFIDSIVPSSAIFSSASAMYQTGYEWNGKKANPALDAYTKVANYITNYLERNTQILKG
jgi:chromosome partitioning protein